MTSGIELAQVVLHNRSNPDCIQRNDLFCPGWAIDNFDRYVHPTLQHVVLVVASVGLGFVIAFALALLAHRYRPLSTPFLAATGVLYTIPSIAFFFLLLPITGRGRTTAIIALTAFTLQIIYRNITTGLHNVPADIRDAGSGMGLTRQQLLWRVELPLALPEIIAGLRVATVSTVAIATLAVFVNGGGLGTEIYTAGRLTFKTGIILAGGLAVALALVFDLALVTVQRYATPWRRALATS
jgi:osmoprotectant transport system permease protein